MSTAAPKTRKRKPDNNELQSSSPLKRQAADDKSAHHDKQPDSSPSSPPQGSSTASNKSVDEHLSSPLPRQQSPPWILSPSGAEYSSGLQRRLPALLHFAHPSTNRYAVSVLPKNPIWDADRTPTLIRHGDHPLTVLLVGEIVRQFLHKDGHPLKYVSINLRMSLDDDRATATKMLRDHARFTPPANHPPEKDDGTVRLSCTTTRRDRHGHIKNYLFDQIYDARNGYGPKSTMSSYDIKRVGVNDLIIAECTVQRYHVDAEGAIDYSSRQWTRWKTGYNLISFSILNVGEEPAPEAKPMLPDEDMPVL